MGHGHASIFIGIYVSMMFGFPVLGIHIPCEMGSQGAAKSFPSVWQLDGNTELWTSPKAAFDQSYVFDIDISIFDQVYNQWTGMFPGRRI